MRNLKISELVAELERIKREQGDIEVVVQTLSHLWAPEPVLRKASSGTVLLLNP